MDLGLIGGLRERARDLADAGIDTTPKEEIHRDGKWAVRVVTWAPDGRRSGDGAAPLPVLLVPPLMVRPLVFDLQPDHSLVRTLRSHGLPTYVLDLGVPDRSDRSCRLDDYVLRAVPRAVDAVLAHARSDRLSLFGYCMGGVFALLHVGVHRDDRVARIATVGSPVDFSKLGPLALLGAAAAGRIDPLVDALGMVPGWMANVGFQLLSGRRAVTRMLDLPRHRDDERYLRSYGALSRWLGGLVPYPAEAFKQLLREMIGENRMHESWLSFEGHDANLSAIRCPVLAFAGEHDVIAPVASIVALRRHLPPGNVSVRLVPGGHVSILGGRTAPETVWCPSAEFLARAGRQGDDARAP